MREQIKDRTRLEHIINAINKVLAFTEGKTYSDLANETMLFYAVVKNVEIIGEAAYHITKAFCKAHPETEWIEITKMRHVLVHDYYQIKPQTLWGIVQSDLPALREQVTHYIAETDWLEWEKSDQVVTETAVHKNLVQTARRMKNDGMDTQQIARYTGLTTEEIEEI